MLPTNHTQAPCRFCGMLSEITATMLAIEGREGNPVGALFVLGDLPNVLPKIHQMVLNPFQGYRPDQ